MKLTIEPFCRQLFGTLSAATAKPHNRIVRVLGHKHRRVGVIRHFDRSVPLFCTALDWELIDGVSQHQVSVGLA
jgi:hypothetical protein